MLVAFALSSHGRNAVKVGLLLYDAGLKSAPAPFRRLRLTIRARSSDPNSAWPFLFDQKPSVSPPPPPTHKFPNSTVVVSPSATVTLTGLAVVGSQFISTGVNSVIAYSSGSTTSEAGVYRMRSIPSWMRTFHPVIGW